MILSAGNQVGDLGSILEGKQVGNSKGSENPSSPVADLIWRFEFLAWMSLPRVQLSNRSVLGCQASKLEPLTLSRTLTLFAEYHLKQSETFIYFLESFPTNVVAPELFHFCGTCGMPKHPRALQELHEMMTSCGMRPSEVKTLVEVLDTDDDGDMAARMTAVEFAHCSASTQTLMKFAKLAKICTGVN